MCDTCGCNVTPAADHHAVEVLEGLLAANDHEALHNREHFSRHNVLAINLMSSPGAGKTALLEATIDALGDGLRVAVVEGDLADSREEHLERRPVQAALGDDHVGVALGRLDEGDVHGPNRVVVLPPNLFEGSPAVLQIPPNAPNDAVIGSSTCNTPPARSTSAPP